MSAEQRHESGDMPDATDAIDALADRVDTLASMVRETAGSLAASRGEVASLDRRVQERIGEDTDRAAAALQSVRGEIDALRAFIAEAPQRSDTVVAAASDPLRETVATLAERVETLAEMVRATSGRLVAEQSRIAVITEALAKGDERTEARFSEIQHGLRLVTEQAARTANAPAPAPSDAQLEHRVDQKVGTLAERVDFLSKTVSATAGKLAAKDGEIARVERRSEEAVAHTDQAVRAMRDDLEALQARIAVDPMLKQRVDGLVDAVETLGDRVGTLSGIVGETAGRSSGREQEIAALDGRLGVVGGRIEDVARELRREIDALAAATTEGAAPVVDATGNDTQMDAFGEQLVRLEAVVADASGAAEQLGLELRDEIAAVAAAVAREHHDLAEATQEWEARRLALESRMDELAAFTTSTTERGANEMGRALHTMAERLEQLEHDRRAVASDATYAESSWAEERAALEARLDAIAASITSERPVAPEVGQIVEELAGRLARMEGEQETVADLAALAETWISELAALEARVDEGLSTLEVHGARELDAKDVLTVGPELSQNLDELSQRIEQIERDRDAVRDELTTAASAWASERASLQERVSELAARIVTGPISADQPELEGDLFAQSPQELDRLRVGVEGLRMRLAYHEKTVSDLAGSRGVAQRLDELTARLDHLAAIVAAGPALAGNETGMAALGSAGVSPRTHVPGPETAGLMTRLEEAERLRSQNRDKMLEQMEKIASRMDWRLQRLEAAGVGADESPDQLAS